MFENKDVRNYYNSKKVSFGTEQLSFATDAQRHMFPTEMQPEPVFLKPKSKSRSRSNSKKKKQIKSSLIKGGPLIRPGGKPWSG